jgi:tetratricopeptide (TPR) repeat protein
VRCRPAAWAALALLAACAKGPEAGPRRVILAPVENLSAEAGDPGPEALQMALWASLQGQEKLSAALAGHRRETIGQAGAMVLTGYAAGNRFHLSLGEQRFACRGTVADCAGRLAGEVGRALGVTPRGLPKMESVLALAKARQAQGEETARLLEEATAADPLFSGAWLARASHAFARGGAGAASETLSKAPVEKMDRYDAARVRLQRAELTADVAGKTAALLELAKLTPADGDLQLQAGAAAAAARQFAAAADLYRRALAMGPNPALRNELAYALALQKDQQGAYAAVKEILAAAPGDPRYLDTAGDIAYYFGDYRQAAAHYGAAVEKDAAFLGGLTLFKSALAAQQAGDSAKAAAAIAAYQDLRAKGGDAAGQPLLEALWLYRTGRKEQALEILEKQTSPRAALYRGLAALVRKDFAAAEALARGAGPADAGGQILMALARGTKPPPGFPIPATALEAVHAHLRGDEAGARKALAAFRARMHPYQEGAWPLLAGEKNVFPAALEDWLAFLLS